MQPVVHSMIAIVFLIAACQPSESIDVKEAPSPTLADRAMEFRSLMEAGEWDRARAMAVENPRRWWETRSGEGQPWLIGPNSGPWSRWDEYFGSEREILDWVEKEDSVTVVIREINDYYRLLERGPMTSEVTYFFDDAGKIEGMLIRGVGERPPGRTDEFVGWARSHHPEELDALMPDGSIDPTADHPERFRKLLTEWRAESGLDPIGE